MKKSIKPLLVVALVAASLGTMSQISAKPYGDGYGDCMRGGQKMGPRGAYGGKGFNIERMSQRLDLTEEQRTQVESIVEKSAQQFSDLRSELQQNRESLRELSSKTPFDEVKVRELADKQGDLKADMIVLRAQRRSQISAILTEEQREQMQYMRGRKR